MSIHSHPYSNPDLNTAHTAEYSLLVKIGQHSFSYAVAGQNRLLVLKENIELTELAQPSEGNNMLLQSYKERIIGLPDNGFTFVPADLYRADKIADFARFLDVRGDEKVFSQSLDAENQVIFKADESLVNLISERFGLKNAVFSPMGWIRLSAKNYPSNHRLYINIDGDRVEILNFNDSKLRFYNVFEFKNADELVYFTMFVTSELNLQPQDVTLVLSGDIAPDDENGGRLAKFFNKIELNYVSSLDLPDQTPAHDILTLTALSLCGSSEVI
jgi:hypothetical protein